MNDPAAPEARRNARRLLLLSLLSLSVPLAGRSLFAETLGSDAGLLIWILALVPPFLLSYQHGWRGASVALAGGMAAFAVGESLLLVLGKAPPSPETVLGAVIVLIVVTLGAGFLAELYRESLRRAREDALTDPLTRLPNRRAALLYLEKAFHAARRGGNLSVVLFDLDHFKDVNDRYGHAAGDAVLRRFGEVVDEVTRTMNLSARYGGEEFISILGGGDADGAVVFCERVRQRLAESDLPVPGITVSAGIAEYEEGMATPEVLVAAADQALYRAKANGRDRVEVLVRKGRRSTPPPEHSSRRRDVDPHLQGQGERILVVDDDEAARRGMARALRRFGYSVFEAGEAMQGLQVARGLDEPLDLVVSDIVMPDIGGFRFIEMLQEVHPPVRVVYTSGYAQEEVEWAGVPGVGWAFVAKPVSIDDLARAVGEVLRQEPTADDTAAASPASSGPEASHGPVTTAAAAPAAGRSPHQRVLAGSDESILNASILVIGEADDSGRPLAELLRDAGFTQVRTVAEPTGMVPRPDDLVIAEVDLQRHLPEPLLRLTSSDGPEKETSLILLVRRTSDPQRAELLNVGTVEIIERPVDPLRLLGTARRLLRVQVLRRQLERQREGFQDALVAKDAELHNSQSDLLRRLARAAEFRDDMTGEHAERVGRMAGLVAAELGWRPGRVSLIEDAAILHDVGKIAVPDSVLLKPGQLTPAEWEVMRRHTILGSGLLSGSRHPILVMAAEIALTHHERWDGSGYPRGLSGEDIPLPGRIVAVVDAYDSQIHRRPYRTPVEPVEAMEELARESGRHFDAAVVDAFLAVEASGRLEEALKRQLVAWPDPGGPLPGSAEPD